MDASSAFSWSPCPCGRCLMLRHMLRASPDSDAALLHEGSTATAAPRMMQGWRTGRRGRWGRPCRYRTSGQLLASWSGSSLVPSLSYRSTRMAWTQVVAAR